MVGELGTYEGLRAQKTASAGPAEYFELSSDDGRPAGGERTAALLELGPQERDRRHTGVGFEIGQRLDVLVPLMGEQLPIIVQFLLVIEVPKILLDRTPQRLGDRLRQPQMVEQLVHVPTVVSLSSLQQLVAEQIVDIPVPGRAGGGGRGGLQDRIQQHFTSSRPLTFQFRAVEVFKALALDRVQQPLHLTLVLLMTLGKGFFALFSEGKKGRG